MRQFSAELFNKAVPCFRNRLKEYVKPGGGHFEPLLSSN